MKKNRILSGTLIVLLVIIAAAWLFISSIKTRALPDYNKDVILSGITSKVEILRDSFAIPHIYAENEADLYMAVGFVMAQDRLWQMDLLRRVTTGRLSEIFGADMADADQLLRSLRMTQKSRRIFAGSEQNLQKALESFCSGVNQFIEKAGKKLPPEFALLGYKPEKWLPEHSINLIGYMAWDLSTGWNTEVLLNQLKTKLSPELFSELLPDMLKHSSYVYPDFKIDTESAEILGTLGKVVSRIDELGLDVFRGSNNWAVSGEKSTTGKPLLANDMHLSLMIPGIWYQMHEIIPGKLNVTGVVLPGQPMVVAGHNDRIAWGFTNVMVDDVDFYEETINPANPDEYKFNGNWVKMEKTEENILTKKGDTIHRINRFTHRGPIISSFKKIEGKTLSMRWLGNEESNELKTVYLLNRAGNWDQFQEALRTFVSVNQNAVYADIDGNIGLQSTIGIPLRNGEGVLVYPGLTDEYDWKGIVPFDELPFIFNPPSGIVSSANNRTANPEYPYYISAWYDLPYRKDRIDELLNAKPRLSPQDFADIQADQTSKMAQKFLPVFLSLTKPSEISDKNVATSLDLLKKWNCSLDADSPAAALFETWYYMIYENLALDDMDSTYFESFSSDRILVKNFMENILQNQASTWCDNRKTASRVESYADIITASFTQTLDFLERKLGGSPASWEWGKIHTFTIKHPMAKVKLLDKIFGLSRGPYPVGGSFHTVSPYSYPFFDPTLVNHGASHRHIFNLADFDASLTVIPTGTSGIPSSPYYCDQTEQYINNQYRTDYLSRGKVESSSRYRITITGK